MELLHSLLTNLWAVVLVVFFFGGSIFVHELGHFLAARRRGVHVERFSIGMGPPMVKWTGRDGVEYWISWLPIGGYVKLPQLADLGAVEGPTAVDTSRLPPPSYTTKVVVFLAGAVFNLIFAFFLATILWLIGMPTPDDIRTTQLGSVVEKIKLADGREVQSPASQAGIQPGDTVLKVDGKPVADWPAFQQALVLGAGRSADGSEREVRLTLQRQGRELDLVLNPVLAGPEKMRRIGVGPAHVVTVEKTEAGSLAEKIGLKPGDVIQAMNGVTVYSFAHLLGYLESHSAAPVALSVQRAAETVTLQVPAQPGAQEPLAGMMAGLSVQLVRENPFVQLKKVFQTSIQSLVSLVHPRSDVGIDDMSGPIGIVMRFWEAATSSYPMRVVIWFTILINISLAIFNLLPIPVLDGGHILFATIAKLRGRALPPEFINAAQGAFMILLFSMMIYVSFWDVRREIRNNRSEPAAPAPTPTPAPAPAPAP